MLHSQGGCWKELRIIRQPYFWLHLSPSVVTVWPGLDQAVCLVHSRLCICLTWVFLLNHSPLIILSNFSTLTDVLSPPLCPSYPLPCPHLEPLQQPHGPPRISDGNLSVPALSILHSHCAGISKSLFSWVTWPLFSPCCQPLLPATLVFSSTLFEMLQLNRWGKEVLFMGFC